MPRGEGLEGVWVLFSLLMRHDGVNIFTRENFFSHAVTHAQNISLQNHFLRFSRSQKLIVKSPIGIPSTNFSDIIPSTLKVKVKQK